MNNNVERYSGTNATFPRLSGTSSIAVGDRVKLRYDKRVWTITGVSHLRSGIVLTVEHTTLITREHTMLHTSYLNVVEVI